MDKKSETEVLGLWRHRKCLALCMMYSHGGSLSF